MELIGGGGRINLLLELYDFIGLSQLKKAFLPWLVCSVVRIWPVLRRVLGLIPGPGPKTGLRVQSLALVRACVGGILFLPPFHSV